MAYEVYLEDVAEKLAAMGIDFDVFELTDTKINPEYVNEGNDDNRRFIDEKASNSNEEFASFLFYDLVKLNT